MKRSILCVGKNMRFNINFLDEKNIRSNGCRCSIGWVFYFFLLLKVGRALFSQAISKQMDDGNADDFHFVKKNI